MSQAFDKLLAAKKALDECVKTVEDGLAPLHRASQYLSGKHDGVSPGSGKSWQWVVITDGPPFPDHIKDSPLTISAQSLPTGQQIAELLSRWHALDQDYRQAWDALAQDEQTALSSLKPELRQSPKGRAVH